MNKFKYVATGLFFLLSGCSNGMNPHEVQEKSDYEKFCNVDMDEVVPGNYIVNKVDQKYFYISSNGNLYSKNEIERLKSEREDGKNKITGIVNSVVGFNVIPTKRVDNSNIENAKKVVVRKFFAAENVNSIYCTSILATDDQPEKYTTKKYKMVVKSKDYTNVEFYNNSEGYHIFLTPLY